VCPEEFGPLCLCVAGAMIARFIRRAKLEQMSRGSGSMLNRGDTLFVEANSGRKALPLEGNAPKVFRR